MSRRKHTFAHFVTNGKKKEIGGEDTQNPKHLRRRRSDLEMKKTDEEIVWGQKAREAKEGEGEDRGHARIRTFGSCIGDF